MVAVPKVVGYRHCGRGRVTRPAFEDRAIYSAPVAQEWRREDGTPTDAVVEVNKTLHWYLRAFRDSGPPNGVTSPARRRLS
jgi:hypothetical protein